MMLVIGVLMFGHLFGMCIGWIALLSGDLWNDKTYYQRVMMLLGWEWYLALEMVGEER
jgi:hypothetical protein